MAQQTGVRVFGSAAQSAPATEDDYNRDKRWAFWIALLTLGLLAWISVIHGLYCIGSNDDAEHMRGRAEIRGTIAGAFPWWLIYTIATVAKIIQ